MRTKKREKFTWDMGKILKTNQDTIGSYFYFRKGVYRSLDELRLVAESYFGEKWRPTERQFEALVDEAKRRGYFERWKMMEI